MRYPYISLGPGVPFRPYLRTFLRHGFATTDWTFGLIDSGADYSIFPYAFAKTLKIDLAGARIWTFAGTTGQTQIAYVSKVQMHFQSGQDTSGTEFQLTTEVGFCPDFNFPGVLLGQRGFFSHFQITFHEPNSFFEIEPFQQTK